MFNFEDKPVYKDARRAVAKIYNLKFCSPKAERGRIKD